MTNELISMNHLEDQLTVQDDPGVWKEILAVLGEEFLQRYRAEQGEVDCKSRPHHLRSCVRSVRRYLVPAAPQPSSLSIVIQSNSNAPTESSGCNGTENPCGEQPRQFGNIASDTFTPPRHVRLLGGRTVGADLSSWTAPTCGPARTNDFGDPWAVFAT